MHKLRQGENVETAEECYMISIKKKKSLGYSLVCVVSIYPCRINYSLVCVVSIPVEYSVIISIYLVCMVSIATCRIFLGLRGEYPCRIFSYSLVCVVSIPVEYSLVCVVSIPVEYSVIIWSAW